MCKLRRLIYLFKIGIQLLTAPRFLILGMTVLGVLFFEPLNVYSNSENGKSPENAESAWRKEADSIIKMCDSLTDLYGDNKTFDKKIQTIKNKIPANFSELKIKTALNATDAFRQCRKELMRVRKDMPSDISLSREDVAPYLFKDSTLAAWEFRLSEVTYCIDASLTWLIWLNTCKAAHFLQTVNTAPNTQTTPPSESFYSGLRDTICTLLDSFPKMGNSIQDVDPYTLTLDNDPRLELEAIRPFIEEAPELVTRLNALFIQGKYSSIVNLLRSKDSTFYGPIVRHTLGILFYNYQIIDSIMLNRYESEIRRVVDNGRIKSADSLMSILESNTQFCFPNKTVSAKRSIRKFLDENGAGSQLKNTDRGNVSSGSTPSFWCLSSKMFHKDDERLWKDKRNLLYLAPKKDHYGFELVNKAVWSSKDFFTVNPDVKKDDYNEGQRIAYLNGKELPVDDENPYIFFADVGGVWSGKVDKAEIYGLGGRYRAYIPDDSIEFFFDRNQKLKLTDVVIEDSSLNERVMQCSYYIAWIGDVNRNGRIEFIIETFESQMGNRFDFIEKQNRNGHVVMETIMTHWVHISD